MYFKRFFIEGLAHASYMIGSRGEAVVIDPARDVEPYISAAETEQLAIRHVIETHLHADFVSGHTELAARTGAEIVIGEKAAARFPHRAVREGDELRVGSLALRILETPGHTPEGISIVVTDTESSQGPQKVFTGDTLFVGDVGRPDLAASSGYSARQMAEMLWESTRKLVALPDDVEVWPAHGAGSACGKNIGREICSTIGIQRRTNTALRAGSMETFVERVTCDLPPAPLYFRYDSELNRREVPPFPKEPMRELSPPQAYALMLRGYQVIDIRPAAEFGPAHVPGSLNVGLEGAFETWVGALVAPGTPLIIMASSSEAAEEARRRLARIGYESDVARLAGGIDAWREADLPLAAIEQIDVSALYRITTQGQFRVVDVRSPAEYHSGHVPGAESIPLPELERNASALDRRAPTAVICAGGYRSSAGASLLERAGVMHLFNVAGGTSAWVEAGLPIEAGSGSEENAASAEPRDDKQRVW